MKSNLVLAIACMLSMAAVAQSKTPIPDILNQPQFYDKISNSLKALEKGKASYVTEAKGFGGYTTKYELSGESSTVHLKGENLAFVVLLGDGQGDPSSWYVLYKSEIKKGARIATLLKGSALSGKSASGGNGISFDVKKAGTNAYELTPSGKLEAGEYFFVNQGTLGSNGGKAADAFAFTID